MDHELFLYNLHNHNMCEFHLHVQGLWRTFKNHVNSIIFFAIVAFACTCQSIILDLLVIVWLLLVPINITEIRGEPTVLEGSNLQLTCKASGQPEPNITWTKENAGKTGVVQEGKVLTVTNINKNDAGKFTCTAYNGFGRPENRTVYVTVTCEYPLKITLTDVWQRCTFHLSSAL